MWSHSDEYEIQFEEQMPDAQQEKASNSASLLQDGWDSDLSEQLASNQKFILDDKSANDLKAGLRNGYNRYVKSKKPPFFQSGEAVSNWLNFWFVLGAFCALFGTPYEKIATKISEANVNSTKEQLLEILLVNGIINDKMKSILLQTINKIIPKATIIEFIKNPGDLNTVESEIVEQQQESQPTDAQMSGTDELVLVASQMRDGDYDLVLDAPQLSGSADDVASAVPQRGGGVWDQAQSYVNAVYEHATPCCSTNSQGLTFFSSLRQAMPVQPSTNSLESNTSIEKSPAAQPSSLYEKLMKAMNDDQINVTELFTRSEFKCKTNNDLLNCASAVMQYFFDRLKHKKSLYDGVVSQQVGSLLLKRTEILDKINEKLKDIKVSVAVREDTNGSVRICLKNFKQFVDALKDDVLSKVFPGFECKDKAFLMFQKIYHDQQQFNVERVRKRRRMEKGEDTIESIPPSTLYQDFMQAVEDDWNNSKDISRRPRKRKTELYDDIENCAGALLQYIIDKGIRTNNLPQVTGINICRFLENHKEILERINKDLSGIITIYSKSPTIKYLHIHIPFHEKLMNGTLTRFFPEVKYTEKERIKFDKKYKSLKSETEETSSDLTVSETQTSASTILECSGGAETNDSLLGELEAFLMDEQVNDSNSIYDELEKRLMDDSAEQASAVRSP